MASESRDRNEAAIRYIWLLEEELKWTHGALLTELRDANPDRALVFNRRPRRPRPAGQVHLELEDEAM